MLNANLLMDTTHLLPVHFHYLVACTDHQPADCRLNHNCQAHVWWLMSQSNLKLLMIQHTPTLQNLFIEDRTNFPGLKHLLYNGLELSSCIPTKMADQVLDSTWSVSGLTFEHKALDAGNSLSSKTENKMVWPPLNYIYVYDKTFDPMSLV